MELVQFVHLLAMQDPSVTEELMKSDPVMWPYYAAIATLFGALTAGAGAFLKFVNSTRVRDKEHSDQIEKMADDFRDAMDQRSLRISEEFNRKDDMMLTIAREQTAAYEKFAIAINELTDAVRDGGEVAPEVLDMVRQVNELWTWVGRTDHDTEALRVYTPKSLLLDVKSMNEKLNKIIAKLGGS